MTAGDAAAALGMPVVPATADVRDGYTEINTSRDLLAGHITATAGAHAASAISGLIAGAVKSGPTGTSNVQADLDYVSLQANTAIANAASAYALASTANTSAAGRALNYGGDANAVRYAEGPTANAYARTVAGGGFFQVWMDNGLQFGRNTSSRRYKEAIEPHTIDPAAVLQLQPVTYHRISNDDPASREFGLIAEDVDELVPELVTWYADQIDGVRYDLLAVALLSVVQDQAQQLTRLQERLTELENR